MNTVAKLVGLSLGLLLFAVPQRAASQEPAGAAQPVATPEPEAAASKFSAAQLEQIVAPIALYPDSLLTQIMMASTYPLEVVEASRWVKANPGLSGKKLEEGLKAHDWDPSVKSICAFPDVLNQMNENLDWTQDLGDAFLSQRTELMDTVQIMRGKAYEAGNLKTTEQQTVTQREDKIIVIESPNPQVVYVPTYSPVVVYGAWSYPAYYYPPMYAPPPYGYGAVMFAAGVAIGAGAWGGSNWGWGSGDCDVNVSSYNEFNRNTNVNPGRDRVEHRGGDRGKWNHNPEHRKGVNYRDGKTAQQHGAKSGANRVTQNQARGYGGSRGDAAASTRPTSSQRYDARSREQAASRRSGEAGGGQARDRASSRSSGGRGSAWSGSRSSGMDRSASSRGSSSRHGSGGSRGGGGGSRGGGGGRRR